MILTESWRFNDEFLEILDNLDFEEFSWLEIMNHLPKDLIGHIFANLSFKNQAFYEKFETTIH